jgi:DNA-binding beta-propeller fold protein YncE
VSGEARRLPALAAAALFVLGLLATLAPGARAAAKDPLYVFAPSSVGSSTPPPRGYFADPCGIGVDSQSRFYVSDYYHDAIDVYDPGEETEHAKKPNDGSIGYRTQLAGADPLDGPCALALDASGRLYVNNYHRAVLRYGAYPAFGAATAITGAGVDSTEPTGIAVDPTSGELYVDERTYVAVYDSSGNPVMNGLAPLRIAADPSADYYGLAFYEGRLYLADAAQDRVEIYNSNPALDITDPVAVIDSSQIPGADFVSLRDSALAVDSQSGELYVTDDLQPEYTEQPRAIVYVFGPPPTYAYEGHLKYEIVDPRTPGLAVDDSSSSRYHGRVYVTSGNTYEASVYAYPPGAATTESPRPPSFALSLASSGAGAVRSSLGELDCSASCSAQIRSGVEVVLSASPEPGSAFAGWSGACSGTDPQCTLTVDRATAATAEFVTQGEADTAPAAPGGPAVPVVAQRLAPRIHHHRHHHRTRRRHHHHRPAKRGKQ